MRVPSKSRLWLCLALAWPLSACQTLPPPSKLPTPPIVDCEQGKTADVKPFPYLAPGAPLTDGWVRDVNAWANGTLGVLTEERQLRAAEQGCVKRLKAEGVIR